MKYSILAPESVKVAKRSLVPVCRPSVFLGVLVAGLIVFWGGQVWAQCPQICNGTNTALGIGALVNLTTGSTNTAVGFNALFSDTNGSNNTAIGLFALEFNTNGSNNTATGDFALQDNTGGSANTANGQASLANNTTGNSNTGIGNFALSSNTTGSSNIGLGEFAGFNLTTGKNNIDIGNIGTAGESAKIRIGNAAHKNTFIAGISGVTVARGVGVVIDTDGHLGTVVSSERYKNSIKPMGATSEAILALKPVTFRYKKELDPAGIPQFGLVAEQVEKVNPDLVAMDEAGKPYAVRYEAVNAMLLNEFLKAHKALAQETDKNRAQEETIGELKAALARQEKEIQALTTNLRKISDDLALRKSSPRVVANDP